MAEWQLYRKMIVFVIGSFTFQAMVVLSQTNFRRYEDLVLSGTADVSIVTRSAIECCSTCLHGTKCYSVNYNRATGKCEINRSKKLDFSSELSTRSGWHMYEKTPCGLGYQTGAHCHHVIKSPQTWPTAQALCERLGGNLAEIRNEQEKDDLYADLEATGVAGYQQIWIGLNDELMMWSNGQPATYTNWESGEPDGPEEQCVLFWFNFNDKWYDYECLNIYASVCEQRFD